jgi:hypothetical protein
VWLPPQQQHWGCSRGVEHPSERWEPPHIITHQGAYPQLRCVCPKRWQRLHCSGPFGAAYHSTDTHKPQSSASARTFDTSGHRATPTRYSSRTTGTQQLSELVRSSGSRNRLLSEITIACWPAPVLFRSLSHTQVYSVQPQCSSNSTELEIPYGPQATDNHSSSHVHNSAS